MQIHELVLVVSLHLLQAFPLNIEVFFSLDLNFLNLGMLLLDKVFAALHLIRELFSKLLYLFGLFVNLFVVSIVVFEHLFFLSFCHFFHSLKLKQRFLCFVQFALQSMVRISGQFELFF